MRRLTTFALAVLAGCASKPADYSRDPVRAGQQELRQGYGYDASTDARRQSPVQEAKTCWRCGGGGKAEVTSTSGVQSLTTCPVCHGTGQTPK